MISAPSKRRKKQIHYESVLVVIDMQPSFEAANDLRTINGVAREIIKAKAAKMPIIFLEYTNEDPTQPCLSYLVSKYNRAYFMGKDIDDGSLEVREVCEDWDINPSEFIVCGVNTQACVMDTVAGLEIEYPATPVTVVRDACHGRRGCRSFRPFEKFRNVTLV